MSEGQTKREKDWQRLKDRLKDFEVAGFEVWDMEIEVDHVNVNHGVVTLKEPGPDRFLSITLRDPNWQQPLGSF